MLDTLVEVTIILFAWNCYPGIVTREFLSEVVVMKVVLLLGVGLTVAVFFGMGLVAEEPPRVPTVCPKDAYLCNMEVMNQSNPGCRHREDHSNTQCMICKRDIAGTEVRMCQATTDPNAPGCNFVGEKITLA